MMDERTLHNRAVSPDALRNREGQDEPRLRPSQLAREWGVHTHTVYRDIRKGALRAERTPSGRFRIRRSDADTYGRPVE